MYSFELEAKIISKYFFYKFLSYNHNYILALLILACSICLKMK